MLDLGAVDGVVGSDVEVVEIGGDFVSLGDIGVVLVLAAGDRIGVSQSLGFLESLVRPYARIEVCGLLLEVVHRHIKELEACAATEEYGLVIIGNVQDLSP